MNLKFLTIAASILGIGSGSNPRVAEVPFEPRSLGGLSMSDFSPHDKPLWRGPKKFTMHGQKVRYHFDPNPTTATRKRWASPKP